MQAATMTGSRKYTISVGPVPIQWEHDEAEKIKLINNVKHYRFPVPEFAPCRPQPRPGHGYAGDVCLIRIHASQTRGNEEAAKKAKRASVTPSISQSSELAACTPRQSRVYTSDVCPQTMEKHRQREEHVEEERGPQHVSNGHADGRCGRGSTAHADHQIHPPRRDCTRDVCGFTQLRL